MKPSCQASPPNDIELIELEEKLHDLEKDLVFGFVRKLFQTKLAKDLKDMEKEENMYIQTDKTTIKYKSI